MNINSKSGYQEFGLDGAAGEGLSIFFSQDATAVVRYRVLVKARVGEGTIEVGEFYISPPIVAAAPAGRLSRMVAGAVCPGATSWSVEVSAVPNPDGSPIAEEVADIKLASSQCCTSPIGVTRVNERYGYVAGAAVAPTNVNRAVLAGQVITGIGAIGLPGDGFVKINGGNNIIVPSGISANPEPKAPIPPNAVITFSNVDYVIEYLESA